MKNYSKDALQELAKTHFRDLGVAKLYATTDGQFFVSSIAALDHAGRNLKVYPLEKTKTKK